MKVLLAIAAGGAVGAVGRYLVMILVGHLLGKGFPYGTIVVNALGSFFLGGLIETLALVWSAGEVQRAFLVIGVLGSFTTFSAFSMDVVYLMERGEHFRAGLYMFASIVLSVGGLFAGLAMFRLLLR
ncbi:MAG: fluoride efflux transporter CrcB [Alphaproteobacteria bacterium]|nr:fluoride efflux transporter CrcB [Alphaproteobacteria bacterium]